MATWRSLKHVTSVAVAVLALAGCSSTDGQTVAAGADEVRPFTHLFGTTDIPVDPQRVVVVDSGSTLEAVLALGGEPVGTLVPKLTGDYPAYIADLLPEDALVLGGSDGEPNLENIANAEPDLIIVPAENGGQRENYEMVAGLAPTVAVDDTASSWRQTLTTLGDLLGVPERAEELLADYDARVDALAAELGEDPGTLSIIRARSDRLNYMGQTGAFVWSTPAAVGYEAPETQDRGTSEDSFFEVSLENTDLLDADRIIIMSDTPVEDPDSYVNSVQNNPLFGRLQGDVDVLPSSEYLFGNILMANHMLDFLESGA